MIFFQIAIAVNFVRIGFTPIYSFLNQFTREHFDTNKSIDENHKMTTKVSPPVKTSNKFSDNEVELNNVEIVSSRQFDSPENLKIYSQTKKKVKRLIITLL